MVAILRFCTSNLYRCKCSECPAIICEEQENEHSTNEVVNKQVIDIACTGYDRCTIVQKCL